MHIISTQVSVSPVGGAVAACDGVDDNSRSSSPMELVAPDVSDQPGSLLLSDSYDIRHLLEMGIERNSLTEKEKLVKQLRISTKNRILEEGRRAKNFSC